jgi:alpha-tubulin suppressor-like RCC1 family protein
MKARGGGALTAGAIAVAGLAAALAAPVAAGATPVAGHAPAPGQPAAAISGTMLAWGANSEGQVGDGTTTSRSKPARVRLPAGTRVTSARAGCGFTVALTRSGQILAWGFGRAGQLGNGKSKNSSLPVHVRLPRGTKVTAIRAGCNAGYALTSAGRVLAWGDNFFGQLGIGRLGGSRNVPVQVRLPKGTKATAISAGNGHGLALTATGRVYAWGSDAQGELGDGHTGGRKTAPVRVRLPAGTVVTSVSAGEIHSMAMTRSGRVLAWGDNQAGELGNGHKGGVRNTPVQVRLPAGARVRGLFGGCLDSLALTAGGQVLAWGANDFGELGDGTTTDRSAPVPVQIPPGTKVTAVSAGCEHGLARTAEGGLLAWGDNTEGELGNGTTADSHLPVPVKVPNTDFPVAVASGPDAEHTLAIVVPAA